MRNNNIKVCFYLPQCGARHIKKSSRPAIKQKQTRSLKAAELTSQLNQI